MSRNQPAGSNLWSLAGILALLAMGISLTLTIYFWRVIGMQQPMWPLPAAYFIEMVALPVCAALFMLFRVPAGVTLTWIAAGAVLAFSILGAWTVGFFYIPVAVLLLTSGLAGSRAMKSSILSGILWGILAAGLQTLIIFGAIHTVNLDAMI